MKMLALVLSCVMAGASYAEGDVSAEAPAARRPAFEVNVLWPFFPGGWVDLKAVVPLMRAAEPHFRGELVAGLFSDYSWGPISRPTASYGKVFAMGAKVGWRQFFVYGLHLDLTMNLGWRHEELNIYDGGTLDGFTGRFWAMGGYQIDLNPRVYLNLRGGIGVHVFRTDRFGSKEKMFIPSGDLNLGIRF